MKASIIAFAAGALLLVIGIALLAVPAGIITGGVLALGAGVALLPVEDGRRQARRGRR